MEEIVIFYQSSKSPARGFSKASRCAVKFAHDVELPDNQRKTLYYQFRITPVIV